MSKKVSCAYNKYFFEQLYRHLIMNQWDSCIDASDAIWHLLDVEDVLVNEYGYRRTSGGII